MQSKVVSNPHPRVRLLAFTLALDNHLADAHEDVDQIPDRNMHTRTRLGKASFKRPASARGTISSDVPCAGGGTGLNFYLPPGAANCLKNDGI